MAGSYVPAFDFATPLAQLGQTIVGNLQAGQQAAQKQQLLSQLGQQFGSGDYKGAAQSALAGGDLQTAMSLFSMGKQFEADQAAQTIASGQPQSAVSPAALPKGEVAQYIVQAARARGIDPAIALKVYQSEGAGGYVGDNGSSFGPMMLHYGGVAPGGNAVPGLGDEFTKATGLDARNPDTWRQQVDFSLDRAKTDGWGAWHGWKGGAREGLPTQVADASGAVPASAAPQSDASGLMARRANILRAMQTPGISDATARRLQAQVQAIEYEIGRADKELNRSPVALSEGQILVDPRTGRQIAAGGSPQGSKIENDAAARQRIIEARGGDPKEPRNAQFIATGKFPREDAQPLTATDKKAILEADDAVAQNEAAIDALKHAKTLSKQAFGFRGASVAGEVGSLFGNEASQATVELDNVVKGQALASLKSIFGAAPTEGERKILLEIQGSSSQPDAVRQKIFDRAISMAERRLTFNRERAQSMRGGDYYKPKDGGAQENPSSPSATLARARDALAKGAPREAILQRLQQAGFDVSGL